MRDKSTPAVIAALKQASADIRVEHDALKTNPTDRIAERLIHAIQLQRAAEAELDSRGFGVLYNTRGEAQILCDPNNPGRLTPIIRRKRTTFGAQPR